jgi:hypothetical protein
LPDGTTHNFDIPVVKDREATVAIRRDHKDALSQFMRGEIVPLPDAKGEFPRLVRVTDTEQASNLIVKARSPRGTFVFEPTLESLAETSQIDPKGFLFVPNLIDKRPGGDGQARTSRFGYDVSASVPTNDNINGAETD